MNFVNSYIIELIVWPLLMVLLIMIFRYFPRKIKATDDPASKNSLFTLMLILGIPVLMFEIIAPILVLMGDERMPVEYKYIFGVEVFILAVYLYKIQRAWSHSKQLNS